MDKTILHRLTPGAEAEPTTHHTELTSKSVPDGVPADLGKSRQVVQTGLIDDSTQISDIRHASTASGPMEESDATNEVDTSTFLAHACSHFENIQAGDERQLRALKQRAWLEKGPISSLESLLEEATADTPWGVPQALLRELSSQAQDPSDSAFILQYVFLVLEERDTRWRRTGKALQVLETLLKRGGLASADLRRELWRIEQWCGHRATEGSRETGLNIRRLAQSVVNLCADPMEVYRQRAIDGLRGNTANGQHVVANFQVPAFTQNHNNSFAAGGCGDIHSTGQTLVCGNPGADASSCTSSGAGCKSLDSSRDRATSQSEGGSGRSVDRDADLFALDASGRLLTDLRAPGRDVLDAGVLSGVGPGSTWAGAPTFRGSDGAIISPLGERRTDYNFGGCGDESTSDESVVLDKVDRAGKIWNGQGKVPLSA